MSEMNEFLAIAQRMIYETLAAGQHVDPISGIRIVLDREHVQNLEELAELMLEERL